MWSLLLACSEPEPPRDVPPPETDETTGWTAPPGHTGLVGGHSTPSAHTGDTSATATADTGAPPIDCTVLPPPPAPYIVENDWGIAEDFDFDLQGNHASVREGSLILKDRYGNARVAAVGFDQGTAGTRVLPTGDYVVSDFGVGGVVRVDHLTGAKFPILTGLGYPNGIEVDRQNRVYVADNRAGRVYMVDAYSLQWWEVARGMRSPNGVILSPDEQTLYVGSFGAGVVWAIDRLTDTTWEERRVFYEDRGLQGGYDGINVDACGNVYFSEFVFGNVWRVTPDGGQVDRIVRLPSPWIPNLRWGHDIGGWDSNRLYVSDRAQGRLFVVDMGIPGKRHVGVP